MKIGYACINKTLAEEKIVVNRSMIKNTFLSKGIEYASSLAYQNVVDFEKVIDWNIEHGITMYRMSSEMFPWMSEYEFAELPDFANIKSVLSKIGKKVKKHQLRLTFHPGPFNVLASPNSTVIAKTIKELRQHGEIMDMIGLPKSPYSKINIHIGGAYGDKQKSLERFVENFKQLPSSAKKRLTVENDDKANLFSVKDLLFIHDKTGIPIVFDFHHHQFCTGGWSEKEAFLAALETWPADITPIVHYSSSKQKYEDKKALETAHADYVYERINLYGKNVDLMLEAKGKELAIERYIKEFKIKEYET